jgi:hypothetical protein
MTIMPIDSFEYEPEAPNKPEPLDDDQLRSIIEQEIREAVNHSTSQIASDQEEAIKYYEGRPFGNEVEGSSQVVLRDVAETIDWAMPAIMRAFFYTSEVVRYEDLTPESEQAGHGKRMSQVVNEIFRQNLRGFPVTYNWAKAGLLERFATVKYWIEEVREPQIESAQGMSAEQLVMLTADENVELFEATPRMQAVLDQIGRPVGQLEVFDARWKRWRTFHRARLENVPPEEFLVSRRATKLDQQVPFVAHRRRVTRSELHSLNIPWDMVEGISTASAGTSLDSRKTTREESEAPDFGSSSRRDKASQDVTLTESYIRVDYDGDGYSELRRVLSGGENSQTILEHDYAPMHGFAGWTPIPMPHKMYGRDYKDLVGDIQEIRSTLLRQLLDNIYRMNNARHKVILGEVDMDSYLDSAAGAPVIVENMGSLEALEVPALPPWSFEALAYLEKAREQRTGIHPYSQESYAAGQNQTAQGVSQVFEAAMAQVQMLCQIFAETGLRDLFTIIPRAMKAAGMGPGQIKVGDTWIPYNPQEWPDEMRVSVQVGLSPGQTEQRIQRLLLLLGLQKEALAQFGPGYMCTPDQLFGTAVRIVEQSGFQNPAAFFSSPEGKEMPQQPPSPEEIKVQTEARDKQAGRALELSRLEYDRKKEEDQEARLNLIAQQEHERELLRIESEERTRRYQVDRQYEAALTQAQVGLVGGGTSEDGTSTGPSPSPVLASINSRIAKLESRPTKKTINRNALGLVESVVEEPV